MSAPIKHIWYEDVRQCPHEGIRVCRFCDFDRYYANTYPDCPWKNE